MKKSFIKVLGGVAFASMMLTACGGSNPAANNTKFFVGVTGPLTGGAASYGLGVKNGAQMAIDEINAAGGLNGILFDFEAMDDQLEASKAGQNYTALYEKGMQMSLGGVTSGACLEFAKYAAQDGVFCLTPSATNDAVPTNLNTYQMCFSDSGQGTAAANYIKDNYSDRTIGVFYDSSDAYSKGIYDNFVALFDGDFTAAAFTSDNKTNFTAQINTLKNANVDFVFMPIYYSEAALFIQQASQADAFSADTVYYGCDGLDGIEGVDGFDPYSYDQEISYLSHFNKSSTNPAVQEFVTKYTNTYEATTLNQFGAAAYDCIYAMYEAMEFYCEANNTNIAANISASELCTILNSVFADEEFSFSGVTGTDITWNADRTVDKDATKYVVNG